MISELLAGLLAVSAFASDEIVFPPPTSDQLEPVIKAGPQEEYKPHEPECWMLPCTQRDIEAYDKAMGAGEYDRVHRAGHKVIDAELRSGESPGDLKRELMDIASGIGLAVKGRIAVFNAQEGPGAPETRQQRIAAAVQAIRQGSQKLSGVDVGGKSAETMLIGAGARSYVKSVVSASPNPKAELDRLAKAGRNDPGALAQIGNQYLRERNPKAAVENFNKALSLEPGNSTALTGRAAANMDLKNYAQAAADAREALRFDPNDPAAQAISKLAHDSYGQGFNPKAAAFAKTADAAATDKTAAPSQFNQVGGGSADPLKGLNPTNGSALQASAYARQAMRDLGVGDLKAAVQSATRAVDLDPNNAGALGLRAFAEARSGRYEEALRDAVAALTLDPNNALAHNARARALNSMGMFREGMAAADDALRADSKNAYAHYMRAMAMDGLGDREGTISALEEAAKIDPRFADAVDLARGSPDEKDLSFLFPEENLTAARAMLAAKHPKRDPQRLKKILIITGAGGLLVCFGILSVAWPSLKRAASRLTRTGPAVGTHATVAGLAIPGPMTLSGTGVVLRGQYQRLGQIGAGVTGTVYEGKDLALDRPIVIRKLRSDMRASDRERLLLPARQAAALNHAGIASLYAVLEEEEALYLVSEFARGRTLRDTLAVKGPLAAEEALPLFRRAADALDYAHRRGICHGAVRASNLVLGPDGGVKLVDFGLARGPADVPADLQAFAACLRETIAGLAPAKLDAVDAALTKHRAALPDATRVVALVETVLQSPAA